MTIFSAHRKFFRQARAVLDSMHRFLLLFLCSAALAADRQTQNLLLVTTDGLRWQEVFRGADEELIDKAKGGVVNVSKLREKYWAETAVERRAKLMPWLWSEVAQRGQLFGNRDKGSEVNVSNGQNFSYPGYDELLAGYADERILSNKAIPNANVTVLEWLHGRAPFRGKVAAYLAWEVIAWTLNGARAGFPIWTSTGAVPPRTRQPSHPAIERLRDATTQIWTEEHFDSFVHAAAREHWQQGQSRVLYISYGETDEWGHGKRYDHYLDAVARLDAWLRELWESTQARPEYRGSTTLLFTTDHGRGLGAEWTSHSEKIVASREMWLAVLGPDTAPLGEREQHPPLVQAQVAATVAALLGEDYRAFAPQAAPPIAEVLPK
jgi:hypothetical protein